MNHLCRFLVSIGTLALGSQASSENYQPDEIKAYLGWLRQVIRPSSLETAASHGSYGTSIGIGHQNLPEARAAERLVAENFESKPKSFPKIFLTKGTHLPLDLSLSHAFYENGRLSLTSLHAQWTVFEDFRLPAFALRADVSRFSGLQATQAEAGSVDLLLSYDVLGFFAVYWVASQQYAATRITSSYEDRLFAITETTTSASYSQSSWSNQHALGLKINLGSPFWNLTGEVQDVITSQRILTAKLAVGI